MTTTPISGETPEKKSLMQKITAPIKKHPRIAVAISLGVALVAGAAILGKDDDLLEIEPTKVDDIDSSES